MKRKWLHFWAHLKTNHLLKSLTYTITNTCMLVKWILHMSFSVSFITVLQYCVLLTKQSYLPALSSWHNTPLSSNSAFTSLLPTIVTLTKCGRSVNVSNSLPLPFFSLCHPVSPSHLRSHQPVPLLWQWSILMYIYATKLKSQTDWKWKLKTKSAHVFSLWKCLRCVWTTLSSCFDTGIIFRLKGGIPPHFSVPCPSVFSSSLFLSSPTPIFQPQTGGSFFSAPNGTECQPLTGSDILI